MKKKNPQIIEEKLRNIKRTNSMDNANTFWRGRLEKDREMSTFNSPEWTGVPGENGGG